MEREKKKDVKENVPKHTGKRLDNPWETKYCVPARNKNNPRMQSSEKANEKLERWKEKKEKFSFYTPNHPFHLLFLKNLTM